MRDGALIPLCRYVGWVAAGLEVQACIQFLNQGRFTLDKWDNPYQAGYNYGYAFAYHFGPTHGTGNVRTIEVGNEPWMSGKGFSDPAFYREVLLGMSRGAKAADARIKVLPAVFHWKDTLSYTIVCPV